MKHVRWSFSARRPLLSSKMNFYSLLYLLALDRHKAWWSSFIIHLQSVPAFCILSEANNFFSLQKENCHKYCKILIVLFVCVSRYPISMHIVRTKEHIHWTAFNGSNWMRAINCIRCKSTNESTNTFIERRRIRTFVTFQNAFAIYGYEMFNPFNESFIKFYEKLFRESIF